MDDAETRLDAFGNRVDSATLNVDDTDGQATLDEFNARLDRLDIETTLARVDVDDTSSLRKIADLEAALAVIRSQSYDINIDSNGSGLDALDADLDRIEQGLADVGDGSANLDRVKNSADGAGDSMGSLLGWVAALSPALITVGAVGSASLLGVVGAASEAGLGLGAFALAAGGSLTTVEAQAKNTLQAWQQTMNQFTAPALTGALSLLPGLLQDVPPAVRSVGDALVTLEGEAKAALDGPWWQQFFSYAGGQGGVALESFAHLLGGLATGFAGLVQAAQPAITWVEQGMDELGAHMTAWGQQSQHTGLQAFIDYAKANGPLVEKTLEDLGHSFSIIVQDASPLGPVMLQIVDAAAELLNDLLQLNPTITSWALGLGALAYSANSLLGPLGGISGVARDLGPALSQIGVAASGGGAGLYSVGTAAGGALGSILKLGTSFGELGGALGLVGIAFAQQEGVFSNFDQASQAAGKSWSENFINALPQGTDVVKAVNTELGSLQDQIGKTKAAMTADQQSDNWDGYKSLGDTLQGVSDKYDQLNKLLPGLTQAQDAQNTAQQAANSLNAEGAIVTAQAAGAGQLYANELGDLTTAQGDMQSAAQKANTALQAQQASVLGLYQSQDSWQQAIDNATASAKQNTGSLDINTTSGLANRTMLDDLSAQTYAQVQAMIQQGASTTDVNGILTTHQAQLEAVAGKYGITKGAVDNYLGSIKLTPGSVDTTLQTSGYDETLTQLGQVKSAIDQIVNHTAVVTITGQIGIPGVNYNPGTGQGLAAGGTISGHPGFKTHTAAVVGEDGSGYDEFVVPTNPAHRGTAVPLAMELNQRLGLMADGGVISPDSPSGTYVGPTFTGAPGSGGAAAWQNTTTVDLDTAGSWSLAPILDGANGVIGKWAAAQYAAAQAAAGAAGAGASGDAASIISKAQAWLGTPYLWGGGHGKLVAPRTVDVDCSGLVDQVFGRPGPTTYGQVGWGSPVPGSNRAELIANAEPADLMFFSSRAAGEDHHVGIYAGNGQMINAPFTGTVVRYDSPGGDLSSVRRVVSGGTGSSTPGAATGSTAPASSNSNKTLGEQLAASYGWGGGSEFAALDAVFTRESGWNNFARNASSGAYGIPQALPPTKLPPAGQASGGSQPGPQIGWGLNYIQGRYGDPIAAEAHERSAGWYATGGILGQLPYGKYDQGGELPEGLSIANNQTGRPETIPDPRFPAGGGVTLNVTVNASGVSDPQQLAQIAATEVRKELTEFMAAMG